jgi:hypothetical protein
MLIFVDYVTEILFIMIKASEKERGTENGKERSIGFYL